MAVVLGKNGLVVEDVYDGLNIYDTRSYDDTDYDNYNCCGFAFQTFSWVHPILTEGAAEQYADCEGDWSLEDGDAEERIDNGDNFPFEVEETELNNLEDEFGKEYLEDNYHNWDYSDPVVISVMIQHLLRAFPGIRVIKNEEELLPDEYAVYMSGCYYDFHFCVYDPVTHGYYHKRGCWPPEETASPAEAFGLKYYGKVTCFAVPGSFNCSVKREAF